MKATKATIEVNLTPDYVLNNAHARYWYRNSEGEKNPPRMTAKRLQQGLALLVKVPNIDTSIVGRIMVGEPDGVDCDVLLQLSLLGEIKYG